MESDSQSADLPTPAPLTAEEARIIGCLIEKEYTVPDSYPLTLNSLVMACNQTTNREPVMSLDESTVQRALENLKARGWVFQVTLAGARVQKFKHNLTGKLPRLQRPGIALLAVLLLRGVQTTGELRQRTERLQRFPDMESVESELNNLMNYPEGAVVACLPAGGGRRVAAYAQLLTGEPSTTPTEIIHPAITSAPSENLEREWKQRVEEELQQLRNELSRLKQSLGVED
jgi:uncharacterized protein YceH (UPF0502 family)